MTKQPEIYCLVGISASGKTTLAHNMVRHLDNAIIVSRDPLREMLFGYTGNNIDGYYLRDDFTRCEKLISEAIEQMVKSNLKEGRSVVLDNTHLQLKYINHVKSYGYPVNFIKTECNIHEAVERDTMRGLTGGRVVGKDVIYRQAQQLEHLCKEFDFARYEPVHKTPIIQNNFLPKAFIFDIDGTLAINTGRSPYEWSRVGEDALCVNVYNTLLRLYDDSKILIVSGRDEMCREETLSWLRKNMIPNDGVYMRKKNDNRKDAVIKEEIWRDLTERYNIIAMFDDRLQVIEHARALGFTVFDVASNTF